MQPASSLLSYRDLGDEGILKSLPSNLLQAELRRRQEEPHKPECGTKIRGHYNTPIHVIALFLILGLSTLACSFPIIARRFPKLPIPHKFLFLSRHFGTGVLIATAFIHLLPTAFVSLTDPCLPYFWNQGYPPMPGLIAMLAVFMTVVVEMYFAMRGARHTHSHEWNLVPEEGTGRKSLRGGDTEPKQHLDGHISLRPMEANERSEESSARKSADRDFDDDGDDLDDLDVLDPIADEFAFLSESSPKRPKHYDQQNHEDDSVPSDQDAKKLFLQCLMLEAGILFHSIFIGMAVSVATGTQFVVLLIAICFHQTFEGFALGSRIAALIPAGLFEASSPKPWLMALAYGATTPIGQAVGLWMHELYDPQSMGGLLTVGITNAISSGLLLFAGLVQLIAEDFLSSRSYVELAGRRRIEACLAVACGGFLMAVVGAFA